ncbi:hypothetical protein C0Q70_18614 [Pomacea canaliculata]|uniref:Caspase recruitment domain-containing protein n=1 Tax=Pomacea canaliculata TaxID=400727 RepID=A0A2T7NH26_POMCA|nr:hypothetical protein C0Q70_18614 [Pomacea canaliculata]
MWQKVKECAHRIHKLEDEGNQQQASRLFLDAVKESDEPGKYTAVFEAFTEVGSELIVKALKGETPNDTWHTERKAMIDIFSQNIEDKLKLDVILPHLKELFFEEDYEAIDSQLAAGKTRCAIRLMLLFMHRKKQDWYLAFMNALLKNDHELLVQHIDPDFYKKKVDEAGGIKKSNQEKQVDVQSAQQLGRAGHVKTSDGVTKIVLNRPKAPLPVIQSKKRSSLKDHPRDKQAEETSSLINLINSKQKDSAEKLVSGLPPGQAAENLPSLSTVDENYPEVLAASRHSTESTCDCRCCARTFAEVQYLRSQIQSVSSQLSEVQSLRSDIADMKDFLRFIIGNQKK